ncbi:MAG: hypothetical protein K2Q21_08710 [Chitinophagaceae bacterium]|nr:hypothetical protein [Chitinophagaceae bacterium]
MVTHKYLFRSLTAIAMIGFVGYWWIVETHDTASLGKINKAILITVLFLVIFLIGYKGLLRAENKWVIQLWVNIYFFATFVFLLNGLLYFFYEDLSVNLKVALGTVRNFFLTPLPFAIIVLLCLLENKKPGKD